MLTLSVNPPHSHLKLIGTYLPIQNKIVKSTLHSYEPDMKRPYSINELRQALEYKREPSHKSR